MASQILFTTLKIMLNWWWLYVPAVLFLFLKEVYLYYKNERYDKKIQWILLNVRIPKEVEKTPKAMEQVLHGLHGIHDPLNFKEKWFDGRTLHKASLEIVGAGGEVHFYIRINKVFRSMVETNIYAQYPDAEIFEVEDYVKKIPRDVPNKYYDLWGTDFIPTRADAYPIRTYRYFETEATKLEKRIDPLASLLEHMSSMNEGEHLWVQILIRPFIAERDWKSEGEAIVAKIMGKKMPEKEKPFIWRFAKDVYSVFVSGKVAEEAKDTSELEMLMLRLSPGEQDIIKAIEENIAKLAFEINIRFIYLGEKDVFFKPKGVASTFGIFKQFSSQNLNGLKPDKTKTKVTYKLPFWEHKLFFLKRRLLRRYRDRAFPKHRPPYIFNTEELATIFHFPGKIAAPAPFLPRIEAKKGEPPVGLPT